MNEITVPAHISNIKKLRDFVSQKLRKRRVSPEIISRYRLAVEEAAINIVKHGYQQEGGLITLNIVVERTQIVVTLLDNGLFYDLTQSKDPNLKQYVEKRHRGGLGIFMIRKLMDEIDYSKTPKGNQLRMMIRRKKRPGASRLRDLRQLFLKNKYTGISVAALTLVIVIIYLFFYYHSKQKLTHINLETGRIVSESLATALRNDVEESGLFDDLTLAPKVNEKRLEFKDLIYGILVVERDSNIYYSTHNSILGKYQLGESAKRIQSNIWLYQVFPDEWVYDIASEITSINGQNMGLVHILLRDENIKSQIRQKHMSDLTQMVIILLAGYLIIIAVIHAAVSPIRNLARDIGSKNPMELSNGLGGELQDINKIKNTFQEYQERERGLRERLSEQDKLKAEIQKAQNIQKQLLPKNYPKLEGFDIFALYEAASVVGGDYFDFIHVDDDLLGVVIADVAGKGTAGAMFMTMVRTMLWSASRGIHRAADVLIDVNSSIDEGHVKGPFITAFYLVLDTKRRRLNFASAGHDPMLLYRKNSEKTYYLNPKGFPLGIALPNPKLFAQKLESDTVQLNEGDLLVLYTDGVTEAMNSKRELFGEERFVQLIRENADLPAKEIGDRLQNAIHEFTGHQNQNDDITIVVLKVNLPEERQELLKAIDAYRLIEKGKSIRSACLEVGIPTHLYFNKYRLLFENNPKLVTESPERDDSLEERYLSLEEKALIFSVVEAHPEYGIRRIAEELNSAKNNFTVISDKKIFEELKRSRLNTRKDREAYRLRKQRENEKNVSRRIEETAVDDALPGNSGMEFSAGDGKSGRMAKKGRGIVEKTNAETLLVENLETVLKKDDFHKNAVDLSKKNSRNGLTAEDLSSGPLVFNLDHNDEGAAKSSQTTAPANEDVTFEELAAIDGFSIDETETVQHEVDLGVLIPKNELMEDDDGTEEAILADENLNSDNSLLSVTDEVFQLNVPWAEPADSMAENRSKKLEIKRPKSEGKANVPKSPSPVRNEKDVTGKIVRYMDIEAEIEADSQDSVQLRKKAIRALKLYNQGQFEQAIPIFVDMVKKTSDLIKIRYLLGNAYYQLRDWDNAIEVWQKLREISPDFLAVREKLGAVFVKVGLFERASKEWEYILHRNPDRTDIVQRLDRARKFMRGEIS